MRRRLIALGLVAGTGAWLVAARGWMRVAVAGESMTSALLPGDFLVLRRGAPPPEAAAGAIVAVADPRSEGGGRILLKRIVGLPGESLRVGGGVQINGRTLEEPYAHGETPYEQHRGINRLAADEYFLIGDHRGASTDSRDFGPVRRDAILGTAWVRYWPPERAGVIRRPAERVLGPVQPAHDHGHDHGRPAEGPAPLPWLGERSEGQAPGTP